jgi:hypothetical protein
MCAPCRDSKLNRTAERATVIVVRRWRQSLSQSRSGAVGVVLWSTRRVGRSNESESSCSEREGKTQMWQDR